MLPLWAFLLATVASSPAQSTPYVGTHFIIAFPDTTREFTGPLLNALPDDARIAIFANDTTVATVRGPGFLRTVTIYPAHATVVWLADPTAKPTKLFVDTANVAVPWTFDVSADHPISLDCYYITIFGSEAFTPLPVEHWGTEYYAMMLQDQYLANIISQEENTSTTGAPSELLVLASKNGTQVTIDATDLVSGPISRTVTLNAGDAYMVQSSIRTIFPLKDLCGTRITATEPIGVISGDSRTEGAPSADSTKLPTGNTDRNSAIEWMAPVELHGTTFVYRPLMPIAEEKTNEVIRVVATAPGTTTVTRSNGGTPILLNQGAFAEYRTRDVRGSKGPGAFAISTDRPAEAMLVTGTYALLTDSTGEAAQTWAPAMTELPPHERWGSFARFHATLYPTFLHHYLSVVADSGTRVWLDGGEIAFDPAVVAGTMFRQVRLEISAGDHLLRSIGGSFSAIAYGEIYGSEAFRPLKAEPIPTGSGVAARVALPVESSGEKGDGGELLHRTVYQEFLGITYAAPAPSQPTPEAPPDSLAVTSTEGCDSTVILVERIGADWRSAPIDLLLPADSTNVEAIVAESVIDGVVVRYRIILRPRDPARDAAGAITFDDLRGGTRTIPYSYRVQSLAAVPSPVTLTGVIARRVLPTTITITNVQSFPVTITALSLAGGASGFSLPGTAPLPITLAPGAGTTITLNFRGAQWGTAYADTLLLESDCRGLRVPLSAATEEAGLRPLPEISGYDWHQRLAGSTNDTLSFVTNSGGTPYDVKEILLADDASGAFNLVAPDWHAIGRVSNGDSGRVGIRFSPTLERVYVGRIMLVTTDGDTADAELRGIGVLPHVSARDVTVDSLCLDRMLDTMIVLENSGGAALVIDGVEIAPLSGSSFDLVPGAGYPSFPLTLLPDSTLTLPLRLLPRSAGNGSFLLTIHSNAADADSTLLLAGTIVVCARPRLVVDSLDFGSVWITLTGRGYFTLRNLGPGDAMVNRIAMMADTAAAFTIAPRATPFLLRGGDTVRIPATFMPMTVGPKSAVASLETDVGTLYAELRGIGARLIDTAFVRRDYHAQSGDMVPIRIELLHPLDTIPIDSLAITLGYDRQVLDFLGPGDGGPAPPSLYTVAKEPDTLRFTLPLTGVPVDSGTLAVMRFLARLTAVQGTELPLRVESGLPYLEIVSLPGHFQIDPICGLSQRLFEWTIHLFRLEQNQPNPVDGATRIEFEIPIDGPTTLIVYDLLGAERLRLVDGTLDAGVHAVTVPAGALSSGIYEYQLVSDGLQATRRMVIR